MSSYNVVANPAGGCGRGRVSRRVELPPLEKQHAVQRQHRGSVAEPGRAHHRQRGSQAGGARGGPRGTVMGDAFPRGRRGSFWDAPGSAQVAHYLRTPAELDGLQRRWTRALAKSDGPGLDCEQFTSVVLSELAECEPAAIEALFSHLDIYATGYVAWDAFFGMIFEESKKSTCNDGPDAHTTRAFRERQLPGGGASSVHSGDSIKALHYMGSELGYIVGVCRDRLKLIKPHTCEVAASVLLNDEGKLAAVSYIPAAYAKECVGKADRRQGLVVASCSDLSFRVVGVVDRMQRVAKVRSPSHSSLLFTSLILGDSGGCILAGTRLGDLQLYSAQALLFTAKEAGSRVLQSKAKRDASALLKPFSSITPHSDAITCIVALDSKRQIATASLDATVRLFDVATPAALAAAAAAAGGGGSGGGVGGSGSGGGGGGGGGVGTPSIGDAPPSATAGGAPVGPFVRGGVLIPTREVPHPHAGLPAAVPVAAAQPPPPPPAQGGGAQGVVPLPQPRGPRASQPAILTQALKYSGHSKGVLCLAFSEDHSMLLSGGDDKTLLCYAMNTGKPASPCPLVDTQSPHLHSIVEVRFVPQSRKCISNDATCIFKVWDVRSYQSLQTFCPAGLGGRLPHSSALQGGSAGVGSDIAMGDVGMEGGSTLFSSGPTAARLSPGFVCISKYVTTCTSKFCSWVSTVALNPTAADDNPLTCVLPLGNCVVTGAGRGVKIWSSFTGRISKHFPALSSTEVTHLAGDFFGKRLCVAHHEAPVTIHHLDTGDLLSRVPCTDANGSPKEVSQLNYDVVRSTLHVVYEDGTLVVVTDKDAVKKLTKTIRAHPKTVKHLVASHKQNYLVTADMDRVSLWGLGNMSLLMSFSFSTGQHAGGWVPQGAKKDQQQQQGPPKGKRARRHQGNVGQQGGLDPNLSRELTALILLPNASCIVGADTRGTIALYYVSPGECAREITRWDMTSYGTAGGVSLEEATPEVPDECSPGIQHLALDKSEQAACMSLTYHWQASLLYSLDERGVVTAWCLDAVLEAAHIVTDGSAQVESPVPCSSQLVSVSTWFWSDPAQQHPFKCLQYSPDLGCIIAWNEVSEVQCWDESGKVIGSLMQESDLNNGWSVAPKSKSGHLSHSGADLGLAGSKKKIRSLVGNIANMSRFEDRARKLSGTPSPRDASAQAPLGTQDSDLSFLPDINMKCMAFSPEMC